MFSMLYILNNIKQIKQNSEDFTQKDLTMRKYLYIISCMDTKEQALPERFMLHPRHIAQGHYILGTTANRLLKMAMSRFDWKNPKSEVKFSFSDYFREFGIEKPGNADKLMLKKSLGELRESGVEIAEEYPDGGFGYTAYNFISYMSAFLTSWDLDEIKIKFTDEIAMALAEYKKSGYSLIDLERIKNLQGKYKIRFYEIAMSHEGQKNKNGEWWFEHSIEELRDMLKTEKMYNTTDFRNKIINRSIIAINKANIGIRINTEHKKRMKEQDKIHFNCKYVDCKQEVPIPVEEKEEVPATITLTGTTKK
jgi:hypothetical protein